MFTHLSFLKINKVIFNYANILKVAFFTNSLK